MGVGTRKRMVEEKGRRTREKRGTWKIGEEGDEEEEAAWLLSVWSCLFFFLQDHLAVQEQEYRKWNIKVIGDGTV